MSNPTRKAPPLLPCFLGNERREQELRSKELKGFSKDCLAAAEKVQLKMEAEFFITCPSQFFFSNCKCESPFQKKVKAFVFFCIYFYVVLVIILLCFKFKEAIPLFLLLCHRSEKFVR